MGVLNFDGKLGAVVNLLDTNQGAVRVQNLSFANSMQAYLQAVGAVPAWFVNTVTGNDTTGDGLTAQTAFKSGEKLSATLCPGGAWCPFQQDTTINLVGAITELSIFADWPATDAPFTKRLLIQGVVTPGATQTLTAVVNTNPGVARGQLTATGGNFTNKRRIRALNGANAGAIAFSTGPNGGPTNHFVSQWWDYNASAIVNIANGTQVSSDLSPATTIQNLTLGCRDPNYIELRDVGLANGGNFVNEITTNFLIYLVGCDLTGGLFGNYSAQNCRIVAATRHGLGFGFFDGCAFQSSFSVIAGGFCEIGKACVFDSGSLIIGNHSGGAALTSGGLATVNAPFQIEWENGVAGAAVNVAPLGSMQLAALNWGQGFSPTPWATGFQLASGCTVVCGAAAQLAIPATQPISATGHNLAYAAVPFTYARAACTFAINPDPAAAITSV